jgi:hypothetical protein
LLKNCSVVMLSFLVLARATRRFETRVRDWEANIALIAPQTSDAVSILMVVTRMLGERVLTRKERMCRSMATHVS